MTEYNLDERIASIRKDWVDDVSQAPEFDKELKAFICEVIAEITPDLRVSKDSEFDDGWDNAIHVLGDNAEELLGDK